MNIDESGRLAAGFLYADHMDDKGQLEKKPFGTCFFLMETRPNGTRISYLVTAKHVLKAMQSADGAMYVRLGIQGGGVAYAELPSEGWYCHPDNSVDAVVLPLPRLTGAPPGSALTFMAIELYGVLETPEVVPEQEPGHEWPPREGEEVCIVAFFTQYAGQERNYPIFRFGRIALMTNELIPGEYGPSEYYLIESQVYRGNSGAPVFVCYGETTRLWLLGLLTAAYPSEPEIDLVSGDVEKYYNLGISKVVPIHKVVEILDSKKLKKRREEADKSKDDSVPMTTQQASKGFTRADFGEALKKVSRRAKPSTPD